MAVAIIGGPLKERFTGWTAREILTQSTATANQAVTLNTAITHVGMGTATGFDLNRYSLAAGTESQAKIVLATATGEATLSMAGTSTGGLVFTEANDMVKLEYWTGLWRLMANSGATIATST